MDLEKLEAKTYEIMEELARFDMPCSYEHAKERAIKKLELESINFDYDDILESFNNLPLWVKKTVYHDWFNNHNIKEIEFENYERYLNSITSPEIFEKLGEKYSYPPLDTVEEMCKRYNFLSDNFGNFATIHCPDAFSDKYVIPNMFRPLMSTMQMKNKSRIIYLLPNIYKNVDMIISDMEKFGYFVSYRQDVTDKDNMNWTKIEFEPYRPLPEDGRSPYYDSDIVYHVSPVRNHHSILKNGFIPKASNTKFKYPPRIYCFKSETPKSEIIQHTHRLMKTSNVLQDYVLYTINRDDLENIFYYDPQYDFGVFTTTEIPPSAILNAKPIKTNKS